jgi:hypothetical protein
MIRECGDFGLEQLPRMIGNRECRAEAVGGAVEQPPRDVRARRRRACPVFVDHQGLVAGGRHGWTGLPAAVAFNPQRAGCRKLRGGGGGIDHVQVDVMVGRVKGVLEHHHLAPAREHGDIGMHQASVGAAQIADGELDADGAVG